MGSACMKVTKYFLFLFNLLFFILGAVILGFGVWILADKSSFISVLQASSHTLNVCSYTFISVGAVTMLMGFLGCIGAVKEVRCLLGLYFAFLLLILIAQVAAGTLLYFKMEELKQEVGNIVIKLIQEYKGNQEDTLQSTWDDVQAKAECCGWDSFLNWTSNEWLMNSTNVTYPCSCKIPEKGDDKHLVTKGFCQTSSNQTQSGNNPEEWPVYKEGCKMKVQEWLKENVGVILGVCAGVAAIELLGMLLSICLCRHVHSEDYSKVPKY